MNVTRKPKIKVGYASEKKPIMVDGRRDFFAYRDLGIGEASGGQMRGQVIKAKTGMTQPTGWHYHVCEDSSSMSLNGWVELEFESGETLRCEPGDSVYHPGRHGAQRAAHLGRCRDPRSLDPGRTRHGALRSAGLSPLIPVFCTRRAAHLARGGRIALPEPDPILLQNLSSISHPACRPGGGRDPQSACPCG